MLEMMMSLSGPSLKYLYYQLWIRKPWHFHLKLMATCHEWRVPGRDVTTFSGISYLWDVFRERTDEKHGFKFLNYFKATAMMLSKEDALHIRGRTDRPLRSN